MDKGEDLFGDILQLHEKKPEFNSTYLRGLSFTNFGAGHETIAGAITSVITNTCMRPSARDRLCREVRSTDDVLDVEEGTDIKYARACFREALRLFPVVGTSFKRVVPAGGLSLHGYSFPPGTIVGCHSWALHRNKDLFGHAAEEFRPERWLDGKVGEKVSGTGVFSHLLTFLAGFVLPSPLG